MHQSLGITGPQLALTVTWLDLRALGMENAGKVIDYPCPSEYDGLNLKAIPGGTMMFAALRSITRLGSVVPWSIEDARHFVSRLGRSSAIGVVVAMLLFVLSAALGYFITTLANYPVSLEHVILLYAVILLLFAVLLFVDWVRTKSSRPPWLRGTMLSDSVQPIDSLKGLLRLLQARYRSPLRMLVLGEYPELAYTGRIYRTNRGFQLKEAIFIPSQ